MIAIEIYGRGRFELDHLVLDMNGTLTLDGALLAGVSERLAALASRIRPLIATADTYGTGTRIAKELGIELERIERGREGERKLELVKRLDAARCVAIGNGANDAAMLQASAIGICVIGPEGAASGALAAADVVASDITGALDLLAHPIRLVATLRR